MIVSTDAVVLRSMKYGDSSKIVTFYSQKYGKIKAVAKGARSAKNKFGASLEPMTHSSLIFYKKEQRDLHLLSKCEIAQPFRKLYEDGEKMAVGLAMIELVNMVMHDEEENEPMFNLLVDSLRAADRSAKRFTNIFFAFELKLFEIFGYGLDVRRCSHCGRDILDGQSSTSAYIQLANGSAVCSDCHSSSRLGGVKVSKNILRLFHQLASEPLNTVCELPITSGMRDDMVALLHTYLQYHIEGVRTLKSLSLFTNI